MKDPQFDEKQYEGAFEFLARHFVSITWLDCTPGARADANSKSGTPVDVSAFVISVSGEWFLVTAGHILEDLRRAREGGQRLTNFAINDTWCTNRQPEPIPLGDDYIFDRSQHFYDEDSGFDAGCIYLRPNYRDLLKANDIEPVTEPAWEKGFPRKCQFYVMLGVPSQLTDVRVAGGQVDRISNIVWINIGAVDAADVPEHMRKPCPRFYGKLAPTLNRYGTGEILADIDGMSGGPIFGIDKMPDGQFRYWIVAIQNSWDRSTRVVAGFPLKFLGGAIRNLIIPEPPQQ